MTLVIIILGALFGIALQYANLNKYDVISGNATTENFTVSKTIALAIGVGIILLNLEILFGGASYHIKPFVVGGVILGGLIFGTGMAILGYCPGTLAISLGQGSVDALIGIVGGIFGGVVFTIILPSINGILGPNLGKIALSTAMDNNAIFVISFIVIGLLFILAGFLINKLDKISDYKWMVSGVAIAVLNTIVFSSKVTNRPIGASTSFPYVGDFIFGLTNNAYFQKIETPGNWELFFLIGSFISAVVYSLIRNDFKITLLHSNWVKYKGESKSKRIIWAFIGGFILVFGARMAGGCTSGHIISGGMQLSASSLVFAVFVFMGFLGTGKIFYRKH